MKRPLLMFSAAALLAPAAQAAHQRRVEAVASVQAGGKAVEVMAEEALVRFDETTDVAVKHAALAGAGMELVTQVGNGPMHLVYMPSGMSVAAGLATLRGLPGVLDAQPNRAYRLLKTPNDPSVGNEYHLSNVNAYSAWEYDTGGSNVTIAIMDSGIQGDHPDLSSKIIAGANWDCSTPPCVAENPPHPACYHGTSVAGVAAAATNNGTGVAGVSWGARLVSLKVLPDSGCYADCSSTGGPPATCVASDAAMIAALAKAQALAGPVVVNISLGAAPACPTGVGSLQEAVDNAFAAGVTIVASAGNSGSNVNNPANCNHVIPVGATDSSNNVASFSSRGPEMAANGLVAPGVGLTTTYTGGGYTSGATGTSFSAPVVAGLAALILSAKPSFTPTQVRDTLRNSTTNIGVASAQSVEGVSPLGNVAGAGLANGYLAMRLAITGTAQYDGTDNVIAFPNPFRPSQIGSVSISVPTALQGGATTIKIYTTSGQLVRSLTGLTWDGKNDNGKLVASGTYILLVSSNNGTKRGRVAVIR